MKRKATDDQLQAAMFGNRPQSVRNNLDLQPQIIKRNFSVYPDVCHTPSRPIPLSVSTPFARDRVPRDVTGEIMDADADVELRRIIDNFVSIYEQLDECEGSDVKPNYSYTELAYLAMLRSPNFCLPITEIYRYIQSRFLFFKNSTRKHWKNAVRHSLAKTMCFTKIAIGRGTSNSENLSRSTYLWCIVPNSIVSFARGDYRTSVDKESGTNTLRWGYLQVNAGQFWDQVGNYIANKMSAFKVHIENSGQPGKIFEQQVCHLHGSNQAPKKRESIWNTCTNILGNNSIHKQFSCHSNIGPNSNNPYNFSPLFEIPEPVIGVPAQGFASSIPFCNYGYSSPPMENIKRQWYPSDMVSRPFSVNNASEVGFSSIKRYKTGSQYIVPSVEVKKENTSPELTTISNKESLPSLANGGSGIGILQPCYTIREVNDITEEQTMTGLSLTPPHRKLLDTSTNDSGFESCGSSPESEMNSCRLKSQCESSCDPVLSSCRLINSGCNENSERHNIDSFECINDFSLDWSEFKEPDLSDFCDSFLLEDIQQEIIKSESLEHFSFETCTKENINPSQGWYITDSTSDSVSLDSVPQQQYSCHDNQVFPRLPDQGSRSPSITEPLLNWTASKTWY